MDAEHRHKPHHLNTDLPLPPARPSRRATPVSSPGLFSPSHLRSNMAFPTQPGSESSTPAALGSPYLHPLQNHKVRETHKAMVDLDYVTGRKIINQYEVIEEIGRGVHGKVKLARNLENGENVAIKIVPRFSKKRRLGKVTALSPQDKTKKEIAILKKIRHPNVVALMEIIDDPELKKIYMVLEHVELGEVVWRKKGLPNICAVERMRIEKEIQGEQLSEEEQKYLQILERKHAINELKRANMQEKQSGPDLWSIEHGAADDNLSRSLASQDEGGFSLAGFSEISQSTMAEDEVSRISNDSGSRAATPLPSELDVSSVCADGGSDIDAPDTPGPSRSRNGSSSALEGTMYGAYADGLGSRGRSPSMADSIISHMSSVDFNPQPHDPFVDDFSYVPCFTVEDARATFRDTVLGLEYLHYEGVVHRDIKPANLLWTKDHRVKISDFGVSYFGRPTRDGELDDFVSESEARDFDNDLELAKTVGTPAFFAPELCYTDLDGKQPKISEQIDVWSLGVTLYCLIFARIPFMAEDEFQMFRKIAKDEVYIPTRRLRPVDPQNYPASISLYKRVNHAPYRDDNDLAYEEVDEPLRALLKKMLEKDPEKRIRLNEVKRHPWVVHGIADPFTWMEETDPSRPTGGKKIEVDEREITRAVVPLTLLERARSAMKRVVGKVVHRGEKSENSSRRRATSSADSSSGDLTWNGLMNAFPRDGRRKSIRGDESVLPPRDGGSSVTGEHPLAQSVTASPQSSPVNDDDQDSVSVGGEIRLASGSASDFNSQPDTDRPSSRTSMSSGKAISHSHSRTRSATNAFLALTAAQGSRTTPSTPAVETFGREDPIAALRKARDIRSDEAHAQSLERGLFASTNKRAEPRVSLSTAMAPGSLEAPRRSTPLRPCEPPAQQDGSRKSPALFSPQAVRTHHNAIPRTDPRLIERQYSAPNLEHRPLTAHLVQQLESRTPPPRVYNSSTPASFDRAREQMMRRQIREDEDQEKRRELMLSRRDVDPAYVACPPSPDDGVGTARRPPPTRRDTGATIITSTHTSAGDLVTPLSSPDDAPSPCMSDLDARMDDSPTFASNPSLPALVSGASSVSADAEGDFLGRPGSVEQSSLEAADSLTSSGKHPAGISFDDALDEGHNELRLHRLAATPAYPARPTEEDDDSDSDEGIVMAKSVKRTATRDQASLFPGRPFAARRRDTQTSISSTETAKKINMSNK